MRSMLVNNGAARKLRSLFFLLFMVGIFNVANATVWFSSPNSSDSVTLVTWQSGQVNKGWLAGVYSGSYTGTMYGYSAPSASSYLPTTKATIVATDTLVLQGGSVVYAELSSSMTVGDIVFSQSSGAPSQLCWLKYTGSFQSATHLAGSIDGSVLGYVKMSNSGSGSGRVVTNGATAKWYFDASSTLVANIASAYFACFNTTCTLQGTTNVYGRFLIGNSAAAANLVLNGNTLAAAYFTKGTAASTVQTIQGGGNSAISINGGVATASTLSLNVTTPGTTNLVGLNMNNSSGLTLYSKVYISNTSTSTVNSSDFSKLVLGGKVLINTATDTLFCTTPSLLSNFTGASTNYIILNGGAVQVQSVTSSAVTVPVGVGTSLASSVYTPVTFTSTSNTPTITIGAAALNAANVYGSTGSNTNQTYPYQWSIASSVASATSAITFQTPTVNTSFSSSYSAGGQLGVFSSASAGYAAVTTTETNGRLTPLTLSGASAPYTAATASSFKLPNNTTTNFFVVGNTGFIYPLPTITSSLSASTSSDQPYSYTLTGTNVGTLNATNLPTGLSFSSPTISGTPSGTGSTNIALSNTNIAGVATATLVLSLTSAPIISSATVGVAQAGAAFSYTITANNSPTAFAASLITNGVSSALNGSSSPFSISGAIISSGAAPSFGIDTIQLVASNSSGNCPITYLYLNVLDVPTVTSISPSTAAVDGAGFTITVNGTNFSNGYSQVTWGGTPLTTTYVSSNQLQATVPSSNIARTASVSTATVGVTSAGTNVAATPSSVSLASTVNQTFSISVSTPTITGIYPNSNIAGSGSFTITATGTNFISGVSTITWNGSTLSTTFINSTTIKATVASGNITSAGSANVGVSNIGAGTTVASGTTRTFTIYAQGVTWPFATDGVAYTSGAVNLTPTTLVGAPTNTNIVGYSYDSINNSRNPGVLAVCPSSSSTSINWNADGGPVSAPAAPVINSTFSGILYTNSSGFANTNLSRYIQFDVAPQSNYNFSVSNIVIPITNNTNTGTMYYAVAYSTNGWASFTYLTSNTTAGVIIGNTVGANSVNFSYSTPFIVPNGSTLSIRVILFDNKNSSSTVTGTMNLSNLIIVGSTSAVYDSPTLLSSAADINGTQNSVFDGGYTYSATQVVGHPNVYSALGLPTGLSINSSTGEVTGTPTVQGTYSVIFKADNSNLYPLTTTINMIIGGQAGDPTNTSITPSAISVGASQFTMTVKGTNFVSGKSSVKWIASVGDTTVLSTTFLTDTTLSAIVPATLVSTSVASASPRVVVYNTGAENPTSNTRTFTINNTTPTIATISPAGSTTSESSFTLTVVGTNFNASSQVTWGGSARPTTFVSSTQLTAIINANSTDIASTGNKLVGVSNTLVSTTASSATTQTYVVGNASATWVSGSSNTPTIVGNLSSTVTTTPTLNGVTVTYSGGQVRCGTSSGSTTYPADGNSATVNNTFTGIAASVGGASTATRYIDFKISPSTGYNLSLAGISVPVSVAGGSGSMYYSAGYSLDGTNFTQFSSAANTGNAGTGSIANTYDVSVIASGSTITNFVPASSITVNNGSTLIVRIIAWRKNSSSNNTTTVNIGPLTMVGNVTVVPTPTAPTADSVQNDNAKAYVFFAPPTLLPGVNAVTSFKVYAYANGSATSSVTATALVSSLSLPYNILVTGLSNGTSYAFKVSAINSAGEGALSNISETVIPSATTTWNGIEWSAGEPDITQNAIVAANFTTSSSFTCNNFTVNSGATFANSGTFTVKGTSFVNNGTISGSGILTINGSSAQAITGIGTVSNITINNTSGGVTVTSGASNMLNITGVLTLQRGALTTNSNVTFKSTSITNTGTLAAIDGATNTGSISGTVTVERYIPAGYRGYRDLAPQVHNAGSIFNNWQEGGAFTSGKGIFITGPSATDANVANYATQPAPNSAGLDYSINGTASAYTYNNSNGSFYSLYAAGKIDSIYNTKTINLTPFTGYRVLVRGDRSFNLATTPIVNYYNIGLRMVNPTVLRATGTLVTGTVTYSTSGVTNSSVGTAYESATYGLNGTISKFSMITNPYAAPVRWGTGTGSNSNTTTVYGASGNINASYWFLNPTYGGAGTYSAYNALSGSVYAGNTTSAYIQPGQAFFVQTSASSPTVVFKETAKETSVAKVAVFGAATSLSKIYFSLSKQDAANNYNTIDAAAIAFHEAFTNDTYGPQDAIKFGNNSDNLTIADKGRNLSIDGRLPATAADKIQINISNISGTAYQLDIDATSYNANGFAPYLVDSYKGTTAILASGLNSFKFTVDAKVAASFENRFSIAFKPTTLAVNSILASATLNNKLATISWNTIGEKGVSRFEVEKSTDAKYFVKIGQATAKNTATATYTATDNNTTAATNYYRIKAISEVGTVSYSNVAQLTVNSKQFTVYPNPLVGKTLNVALTNGAVGKYIVTITSVLGQKVHEASFNHQGGSVNRSFTITNPLAAGTYTVTIRNASNQIVSQTNLSVN